MSWQRIASITDVKPGQRKVVKVRGRELAVLHTDEGLWCIDYRCPHTGGPLGDGDIDGQSIKCPLHKWIFDMEDGTHNKNPSVCEPAGVYQLKAEGSDLLVEMD